MDGNPQARKPTVEELGLDPATLAWQGSGGTGGGGVEIAFAGAWVLLRSDRDPGALISVFDHNEWDCFIAGVKAEEFDRAAS